ncbi:hypothetical protein PTTG_10284, partial [Puccinia triticina 1-1 BBBD Race 1]
MANRIKAISEHQPPPDQAPTDDPTAEAPKTKKSKKVPPTDQETRSTSKTPGKARTPVPNPIGETPTINEDDGLGSGNAIANRYQVLIGDQPKEGTAANPVDAESAEPLTTTERSGNEESIRLKIDKLTDQAFAAEDAGNSALAERYFTVCQGLAATKTSDPTKGLIAGPKLLGATRIVTPLAAFPEPLETMQLSDKTDNMPGGVVFDDDARPTSHNVGFTPFFKKNLLELRCPLPLTIFNE